MVIATAALNQPGDEAWAYGRGDGNWQRLTALQTPQKADESIRAKITGGRNPAWLAGGKGWTVGLCGTGRIATFDPY